MARAARRGGPARQRTGRDPARRRPVREPGGRIAYITCSVLRVENEERVEAFLAAHPDFLPVDMAHAARKAGVPELAECVSTLGPGLRLSPATTNTDGFYVALLARS